MFNVALRKVFVIASLVIPIAGALPETALASHQSFRIHNETGRTMVGLWVSNSRSNRWGDNVLSRTLPSGYNRLIVFPDGISSCLFDIAAEFNDGSTGTDYGVNLCRVSNYTFYP